MFTGKKSKILTILVIFGLLVALVPAGVVSAAKCDTSYAVKRGDTLTTIGKQFGYAANQIVQVNKMNKPYTIYVGQRLCIPESKDKNAPKVDSKYTNKAAAFFTAGRTSDSVVVYAFTYPATKVIIKAASAPNTARKFYNLGTTVIQNNKSYKFKLPDELKNAKTLQICLKDRTTSYLQCVTTRPKQ
jgi:spore germination protein YaaH